MLGCVVSMQPPWSTATSTITAPLGTSFSMVRVTNLGTAAPGADPRRYALWVSQHGAGRRSFIEAVSALARTASSGIFGGQFCRAVLGLGVTRCPLSEDVVRQTRDA